MIQQKLQRAFTLALCLVLLGGQPLLTAAAATADTPTASSTTAAATVPSTLDGIALTYQDQKLTLSPGTSSTLTEDLVTQLKALALTVTDLDYASGLTATSATLAVLKALYPQATVTGEAQVTIASESATSQATTSQAASTATTATQPIARVQARATLAAAVSTTYPDYSSVYWNSASDYKANDIGFISFMANFDTPETRSDGYDYGRTDFTAFPGATGTYNVVPYNFVGAFHAAGDVMSNSPLYAVYVVLPQTLTTTLAGMQQAAATYATALNAVTANKPKGLTGFTVSAGPNTADGRQVWLLVPNKGAVFADRGLDPVRIGSAPQLKVPVQVSPTMTDLNGKSVSKFVANPQTTSTNDAELSQATLFAVIPKQTSTQDITINYDVIYAGGTPSSSQYLKTTPTWAQSVISQMNSQLGKTMVLAAYNGDTWQLSYAFKPFNTTVTDTFKTVDESGNNLNLPITMSYQLVRGSDGRYRGSYQLTPASLATIQAAGYEPRSVSVNTEYRDQDILSQAAAQGPTSSLYRNVWKTSSATVWSGASSAAFPTAGVTVSYLLPIDTTSQWATPTAKAEALRARTGVITVAKITAAPLTVHVVDFRDQPLANVTVSVKDSKGNPVTANRYGQPLNLVTDSNGQVNLTEMPYDTYTVTQETTVAGLIKPGAKTVAVTTPTGGTVTLVNTYEAIETDLPLTGGDGGLKTLIGLAAGLIILAVGLMFWPMRRHRA